VHLEKEILLAQALCLKKGSTLGGERAEGDVLTVFWSKVCQGSLVAVIEKKRERDPVEERGGGKGAVHGSSLKGTELLWMKEIQRELEAGERRPLQPISDGTSGVRDGGNALTMGKQRKSIEKRGYEKKRGFYHERGMRRSDVGAKQLQ